MTWVESYRADDGSWWAIVHTPKADGYHCVYGEAFYNKHAHELNENAEPTGRIVSLTGANA